MPTGRWWAIVGIIAMAVLVASCGGGEGQESERSAESEGTSGGQLAAGSQPTATTGDIKRGGTLVIALEQNPKTFDPRVYTDTYSGYIVDQVIEPLVKYDENLEPQPWLAERIDLSPDGLTYTFALRQGVKFHDGTEMDAEAVKFSIDRVRDFKSGPAYSDAQVIADTAVVDKYTFKLTLDEPNAAFMSDLATRIGAVVSPAAVRAKGDEAFGLNPVGTGPFTFGEFRQDNLVRVSKFDGYWRQGSDGKALPYLDGVEFRIISEPAGRLTAVQAGDVHIANAISDADMPQVKSDQNLVWSQEPNFSWSSFLLTVTKPPFDNKALRQAVAFAIDREEIIRTIYEGNREVGNGPIPPPHAWAIDASYQPYPAKADLAKASEKLAEGGQPNGFAFTYWNAAGSSLNQQLAELMQAQLARVGITMNIETADFNGVVIPKAKAQEPGAFSISFSCGFDPDPCVDSRFRGGSSFNYMGYDNPKVSELILAAKRTNDREERAKLYKEVVPLIMEDSPAIIFAYGLGRYVGNKSVEGWSINNMPRLSQGYSEFWLSE
jgi:ABC-type transport system substrate-binding protein